MSKEKNVLRLSFKFVFYWFQLNVQPKQEILSLYTTLLIAYSKPNKNDEKNNNNKNKIKTVATDFTDLIFFRIADYFIFLKPER